MIFGRKTIQLILFMLFIGNVHHVIAQNAGIGSNGEEQKIAAPVMTALKVDTSPVLDGEVLNDPAWRDAGVIENFWQTAPDEGQPASERTEVRIIYSATTFYIGVICYDREPSGIIVSDSRRDASLDETDSFRMIFDTFHDRQNGFVFGTNPAGIEYDAQVTNEAQRNFGAGRQQGGAIGGFNINWDGSWQVQTKVSDIGWSAEFAIPFRTLRFGKGESQTWGVNFQRNIRRRKETAYWVKLPRQFNLYRVSLAGTLTNLDIPEQRNLKIVPYTLGQGARDFTVNNEDIKWDGDVGIDTKYSITPSMTLDATFNTDFAQVEVDEQQINLDRFNLFFPEKRPFFLENAGLFSAGVPGEVELFFSRRIGIGAEGTLVPIVGGARLSGKMANTSIGFLNMQTKSAEYTVDTDDDSDSVNVIPASNFTVARVKQEFPQRRSAIGALFVNRRGTGDFSPDGDYNSTLAVDGQWGFGQYTQLSGFAARTFTDGTDGEQYALRLEAKYDVRSWLLIAGYSEVADNFNPEVGFLQRGRGFRKPNFLVFHRYRPNNFLGLHELRPHISYQGYWDFDGFQETGRWHIDNHWEWKNGYEFHTGMNIRREGVTDNFLIGVKDVKGDATSADSIFIYSGTYDFVEAQLVGNTNQGKWWSFRFFANIGGFFDGNRMALSPTLNIRIGETFNTSFNLNHNNVNLPDNRDFVTNLFRARISYSFTPRIFLQSLIQYNNRADSWSTNLRLGWLQSANTGLFIVLNETLDTDGSVLGSLDTNNRSFIIKYTRLFDVLD